MSRIDKSIVINQYIVDCQGLSEDRRGEKLLKGYGNVLEVEVVVV